MAQNLCVKIEHPEVIKEFRNLVIQKHGQYIGYFGREVEAAMSHWIEINADLLGKKNNSDKSDEHLPVIDVIETGSKDNKPRRKPKESRSKRDTLQMTLKENIKSGDSVERSALIKLITSAGYGHRYAEKEIAPAIIKQYNLDVQEDGMVKVYLKNLDRYEWIAKEDKQLISKSTLAHFKQEHFDYP